MTAPAADNIIQFPRKRFADWKQIDGAWYKTRGLYVARVRPATAAEVNGDPRGLYQAEGGIMAASGVPETARFTTNEGVYSSGAAAMQHFEDRYAKLKQYADEVSAHAFQREPTSFEDGEGPQTPWGEATCLVTFGQGIVLFEAGKRSGFMVPISALEKMPEMAKKDPDGSGVAWYEEDEESCVLICALPHLFTATERKEAMETVQANYPIMAEIFQGQVIPTPDMIEDAKQSFLSPNVVQMRF